MLFSSGGFSVPESLNHFYIFTVSLVMLNNICWHSLVSISIATIITLMLNYLQQSIYIFLSAIYYSVNMICFKVKKQFSQYLIVTTLSTNLTSNFTMTDVTFYTMGLFKLFHTLFYTSIVTGLMVRFNLIACLQPFHINCCWSSLTFLGSIHPRTYSH